MVAGELDVDALLRRMPYKRFRDWRNYYELEPWGEARADYHAAQVVQMLYNINRGRNKQALPLKDFLLKFEQDEEPVVQVQDHWAAMKMIASAHATDEQMAKLNAMPPPAVVTGPVKWPSVIEEGVH